MSDQIAIQIEKTKLLEGSGFAASVRFRLGTAADTPASVRYRIDCLTTRTTVKDWTTVSPASSVTVTVTGAENEIIDDANTYEWRQLTVEADTGLSDQYRGSRQWRVENLYGTAS
jgi:hypothetical protein